MRVLICYAIEPKNNVPCDNIDPMLFDYFKYNSRDDFTKLNYVIVELDLKEIV